MRLQGLEAVRVIERQLRGDQRGWLLKLLDGYEEGLGERQGEVYAVMALPGEVRGNHYHPLASEWFTVVRGRAIAAVGEIDTPARQTYELSIDAPTTLYVPAGLAHAFVNPRDAREPFILVVYANLRYDPGDTVPHVVTEGLL